MLNFVNWYRRILIAFTCLKYFATYPHEKLLLPISLFHTDTCSNLDMETTRRELGFAEMILRKGRPKKKKVPVIKKSEVEEKLLFEIEMREAAQRLLSASSNPQQR